MCKLNSDLIVKVDGTLGGQENFTIYQAIYDWLTKNEFNHWVSFSPQGSGMGTSLGFDGTKIGPININLYTYHYPTAKTGSNG